MKHIFWAGVAGFISLAAGCSQSPTASQVTVEINNQYSSTCPIIVNLDGNNNTVTITSQSTYTFPLVNAGSHTLYFSTNSNCAGGTGCVFTNNGTVKYSTTFSTTSGNNYIGTVTQNGNNCNALLEQGP